jgi:hypothetical protein
LEGNGETVETTAEETKTAKFLMIQDFPITLKDFIDMAERGGLQKARLKKPTKLRKFLFFLSLERQRL